jgi:hypothetical protein
LLALLNDLLDLSKAEAGRMVLEEIPFEVRQLVSDSVRTYTVKAAEKGIDLSWTVEPQVPQAVTGDPLRFRQVLSNLLSNAVKFTERGFVRISVSLKPDSGQPARPVMLEVRVADSGMGIPREKHELIFEKFTQADGSISRRFGGTGLGLAITRKLTELQGGHIRLESEENRGSVFTLEIPFAAAPSERVLVMEEADGPKTEPAARARFGDILLVEDNLINQKVVLSLLRKRGYKVEVASNGVEALEKLEERPFRLVLMDIQMPLLDGLSTTRRIRADRRFDSLPVIAMTAHAMNGDKERCLEAGMNGYLAKPVDHKHLIHTIEQHLTADESRVLVEPRTDGASGGSDPALVGQMLSLFLQLAPERMKRMSAAVESGDAESLVNDAFKLQTAAEAIGAAGLIHHAQALVAAVGDEDFTRAAAGLRTLESELARLAESRRPATPVS